MEHSAEINELAAALAKAQGQFTAVKTDEKAKITSAKGSSYEYTYATLGATLEMVRKPLSDNGLSLMQFLETTPDTLSVTTMVAHTSGQWVSSTVTVGFPNGDMKAVGSDTSYLRRYSVWATLGIATEDDDGEAASKHSPRYAKPAPQAQASEPTPDNGKHWIDDDATRKRFWAYTRDTLGLSDKEVYAALGVEHVHDYAGDKAAAMAAIQEYVRREAGKDRVQRRAEELGADDQELAEIEQLAASLGGEVA